MFLVFQPQRLKPRLMLDQQSNSKAHPYQETTNSINISLDKEPSRTLLPTLTTQSHYYRNKEQIPSLPALMMLPRWVMKGRQENHQVQRPQGPYKVISTENLRLTRGVKKGPQDHLGKPFIPARRWCFYHDSWTPSFLTFAPWKSFLILPRPSDPATGQATPSPAVSKPNLSFSFPWFCSEENLKESPFSTLKRNDLESGRAPEITLKKFPVSEHNLFPSFGLIDEEEEEKNFEKFLPNYFLVPPCLVN